MALEVTRSIETRMARIDAKSTARSHDRRTVSSWIALGLMSVVALIVVAPLLLMLLNAFKSPADYSAHGALALPHGLDFHNLIAYMQRVDFVQKLENSLITSICISLGACALSVLTAYALGVGRVRGKSILLAIIMVANVLPQEALIYPLFGGTEALNLSNSLIPVIVILLVLNSAFGTYLLASVLGEFPFSVIESAQMDGAGKVRVLWNIVLPMIRPTVSVLVILTFIGSWNDFFIPTTFLSSARIQTIPIALSTLQGDRFLDATTTAAASLISLLPTLICFIVFQRQLVRGVSAGAIK